MRFYLTASNVIIITFSSYFQPLQLLTSLIYVMCCWKDHARFHEPQLRNVSHFLTDIF